MPAPTFPPTPGASLDLTGKISAGRAPSITLGPAAVIDTASEKELSGTPSVDGSESSYHPASPASPNTTKRKQSTSSQSKSAKSSQEFALPPPPSRSRKIIQMKPKDEAVMEPPTAGTAASAASTTKGGRKRANGTGATAAGRKIARKTAHSLIERRRRSKMNEEFGVLKDMIPACSGQEMHKLAILQASIDYLRYLESCIIDLKAGNPTQPTPRLSPQHPDADTEMQDDLDEEMSDHVAASSSTRAPSTAVPSPHALPPLAHISTASTTSSRTNTSPSTFTPLDNRPRGFSISSNTTIRSPYMLPQTNGGSTATSPVIFSPPSKGQVGTMGVERFSLTSPALGPVDRRRAGEMGDREAMAALLMLNQDGVRRNGGGGSAGWRDAGAETKDVARQGRAKDGRGSRSGGAMSVMDLLGP